MDSTKYIGMDVHKEATTIAVISAAGKLVMESIVETKASTIVQLIEGLRGELYVTFEEGTWATWLYDLLKPRVTKVVVCDRRKNALLNAGNKSDRIDARKLAELLRGGFLSAVYHGEAGLRTLKELGRSYLAIRKDVARTMNRIKALYRSWSIPCGGASVYAPRHRAEWLSKITEPGVRRRAELFYLQLDGLQKLRQEARRDLLAESRRHGATNLLQGIPSIGPVRAVLLIALMQTPHRFRTKRQLWAYSGLALETHSSGEYHYVGGQLQRSKRPAALRGLNQNHNHDLKSIFKGAATTAGSAPGRRSPHRSPTAIGSASAIVRSAGLLRRVIRRWQIGPKRAIVATNHRREMHIEKYLGALTLALLLAMVLIRVRLMKRKGIQAMHFGKLDKKDFLIPPFALFYFYIVFAAAFDWPTTARHRLFESELTAWAGVLCCLTGLILLFLSLVSFGKSFRVGIDHDRPGALITTGVFAVSRNPIYVAFWFVLLGQFLLFPNLIPLVYVAAGTWLFHRQVLREEEFMRRHYGREYSDYCHRVRRYL